MTQETDGCPPEIESPSTEEKRGEGDVCDEPVSLDVVVPEEEGNIPSFLLRAWEMIVDQWFLVGIACAMTFAYLFPSLSSAIRASIFQKFIAVPIIFFNCGLTLKTNELKLVLTEYKLVHAFIQSYSLGFIPISMFFMMKLLGYISDDILHNFREGFVVLGSLPTTIAMQVILTTKSRGNITIAVVSAAFGNLLGIFITPFYLFFLIDRDEGVSPPVLTILMNLFFTVFLPLCVGQLVRNCFPGFLRQYTALVKPSTVNCFVLIFMVWTSFSKTFNSDMTLGWSPFFQLVTAAAFFYCLYFAISYFLSSLLGFPPSVRVPMLFGSTQKTISIGIPFINILFEGDPSIGFYSLPLLFYHPFQLIYGSLISGKLKAWVIEVEGEDEEGVTGVEEGGKSDVLETPAAESGIEMKEMERGDNEEGPAEVTEGSVNE